MAVTDSFRNAVLMGDVRGVRIMMKDSLLVDPTFSEFDDMSSVARSMTGIYDAHDGRELIGDKSAWNDDYMNKLMVQVVGNFSRERLEHLKKVVKHLRPVSARPQPSFTSGKNRTERGRPQSDYQRQKHQDEREGKIIKVVCGAAAGGVVGGAVSGVVGGSVAVGVVVGALVGGVAVAVIAK